jgi:hypothetical protein
MDPRRTLVFYTSTNSRPWKRDATGAFIPEAKAFAKFHGVPTENVIPVPCRGVPRWKRRALVLQTLRKHTQIETIVFFCHGHPDKIQFGFDLATNSKLANAIQDATEGAESLDIILYACSCARNPRVDQKKRWYFPTWDVTDGCYAEDLLDLLIYRNVPEPTIYAHYTSGHTTRNPYVLTFNVKYIEWMHQPFSIEWKTWVKALKGDLRFNFWTEEGWEQFHEEYEKLAENI